MNKKMKNSEKKKEQEDKDLITMIQFMVGFSLGVILLFIPLVVVLFTSAISAYFGF